ncbi:hypothetical protein L596_027496 [Steinernema carpocapsae]|uniref:Mini-chromosome maintenance complex-binding protein n=1 Tax=Steinernema carpocapsae TaxID=34508 RepID=A0A4U5LVN8_STECR|nr:hypothetical protein L596_027496 [Steinernema carpocapsae]
MSPTHISVEAIQENVRALFGVESSNYNYDSDRFMRDMSIVMRQKLNSFPVLNDARLHELSSSSKGLPVRFMCLIRSDFNGDTRIFSYSKKDRADDKPRCALFGAHGADMARNGPCAVGTDFLGDDLEAQLMVYRRCYSVAMLPGMTDWYFREKYGPNASHADFVQVAQTRFCAGFYDGASHGFASSTAYEIYGILTNPLKEGTTHFGFPQIDVIAYIPIMTDIGLRHTVSKPSIIGKYVTSLVSFFKDFVGPKSNALLLICALCSSRSVTPRSGCTRTCSLPLNITNVKESKPIIEAIKFLMPRVSVLKATDLLNFDFSSYQHRSASAENPIAPLQLAPGTVLIIDETDAPKGIIKNARARRNFVVLRNLIYQQELIYRQRLGFKNSIMDVTIIVLSRQRSHISPTPFCFEKGNCSMNSNNYAEYLEAQSKNVGSFADMRNHLQVSRCLAPRIPLSPLFRRLASAFFTRLTAVNKETNVGMLYYHICLSRIWAALQNAEEVEKKHFTLAYHILSHHPIKMVGGTASFS